MSEPYRFIQYLQQLESEARWQEIRASGATDGHPIAAVKIRLPGHSLRVVQGRSRWALKNLARSLYLSPLLILAKVLLDAFSVAGSDYLTILFVILVVAFFAMLNVYILWAVVVHVFGARGETKVVPPFTDAGKDRNGVFAGRLTAAGGLKPVAFRGTIACIDGTLPGSDRQVVRDMWALDGLPFRLTEARHFAVVNADDQPHICQLLTAPLVVARPEVLTIETSLERMSPDTLIPAEADVRRDTSKPSQYLTLSQGDEVEIRGFSRGGVDDVSHFMLDERVCSLARDAKPLGAAPYRGARGDPGTLVVATRDTPLWIRRLDRRSSTGP